MKIDTVVELEDGSVQFKGELTPAETELVVNLGLTFLVSSGTFNIEADKRAKELN